MATMTFVFISLVFYASIKFGWGLPAALAAIVGTLFFGALFITMKVISSPTFAYLLLLLWVISISGLIVQRDGAAILAIYGSAFAIVSGTVLSYRALQAAAHIPLFIPVAFIIVLAPLLTGDPWKLASEAGIQLVALALLAITPLMILLVVRLARVSIVAVISRASADIDDAAPATAKVASKIASKMTVQAEKPELDEAQLASYLVPAYGETFRNDHAGAIIAAAGKQFKVKLIIRLFKLVMGIGTATYALIYFLAWAAMPINLATLWSGHSVPVQEIALFGMSVNFPLGPYLQVSALLAILSIAGFLAFSSTEDRYGDAIYNSIVHRPAVQLVTLALAYLYASNNSSDGTLR
jgi:hypothetical protein